MVNQALAASLAEEIDARRRAGLFRRRRLLQSPQGAQVQVDGRQLLNFCSNDYLGLAAHPQLVRAFVHAARRYGVGAGASHLVCGHGAAHAELETALAEYTGRQRALLFSTGYMANLGVLGAFSARGGVVHEDRLNHASLLDGARLAGARLCRFPHADVDALRQALARRPDAPQLVAVDGVFSMDGDLAPLPELAAAAHHYKAPLLVDDAHGLGVLGETGGGSLEHFGMDASGVPLLMGTLGKAFGTQGAFVAGDAEYIETLLQFARTYIYTTALPPAVAAAATRALQLVRGEEAWRLVQLRESVDYFRTAAQDLELPLMPSQTPIQPLLLGEARAAAAAEEVLFARGFLLTAIRPPTVPAGSARLRITLSAAHTREQLDALLDALRTLRSEGVLPRAGTASGDRPPTR